MSQCSDLFYSASYWHKKWVGRFSMFFASLSCSQSVHSSCPSWRKMDQTRKTKKWYSFVNISFQFQCSLRPINQFPWLGIKTHSHLAKLHFHCHPSLGLWWQASCFSKGSRNSKTAGSYIWLQPLLFEDFLLDLSVSHFKTRAATQRIYLFSVISKGFSKITM